MDLGISGRTALITGGAGGIGRATAAALVEEGVDCAIRGGDLQDSNLIARRVGIINFLTAASPAYLDRYGVPKHPRELERHRCVNYFSAKSGKTFDWDFRRGDERIEVAMRGVIALNVCTAWFSPAPTAASTSS